MKNSKFLQSIILIILLIGSLTQTQAQERIRMTLEPSGIYTIPCKVNGLKLKFVFDTGAADVHLSLLDAAFMLKNGYLDYKDFEGVDLYSMADGSISENTVVNLKEIVIGDHVLKNVKACVSSKVSASLLLGQSAIRKLGKYTIDGEYIIFNGQSSVSAKKNLKHNDGVIDMTSGDLLTVLQNMAASESYPRIYDSYGNAKPASYTGYGKKINEKGNVYVGPLNNGYEDGVGKLIYTDGAIYQGDFVHGQIIGYGTCSWPSGDKYEGYFLEGDRNGQGTYTWANGDYYKGSFVRNKLEGEGTYYFQNGDKYVGCWKNDAFNGTGTYYFANGAEKSGVWSYNKFIQSSDLQAQSNYSNYREKNNSVKSSYKKSTNGKDDYTNSNVDFYLAQTTISLNLREGPSQEYKSIKTLSKGDYVFLSSVDAGQPFRKVLYIDGNVYGYVSNSYLTNLKKIDPDDSGSLTAVEKTINSTASITITNNTEKTVTITIGKSSYKFKPQETKTINSLKPGKYKNTASSPGVIPYVGYDRLEAGYVYKWQFYIRKSYR